MCFITPYHCAAHVVWLPGIEDLEEIIKVVILRSSNQQSILDELVKLPVRMYKHGVEEIIDISPAGIYKWNGLQTLGLQPGEYIAFGNDANDIPMFQFALRSICVGDHVDLKQIASESILSQEEEVIRKIHEILIALRY